MKILYVFNHGRVIGGGELSFFDLVVERQKLGDDVFVVLPEPGEIADRFQKAGVPFTVLAMPKLSLKATLWIWPALRRLRQVLCGRDLVHVNGARAMLFVSPVARLVGVPCVWHVRVLEREWLDYWRGYWASLVIANSGAVSKTVIPYLRKGCPVEVVYNGIDVSDFENSKSLDIESKFGVNPGIPVVLIAARLVAWKGHEDLLRAFELLIAAGINCQLLIVGQAVDAEGALYEQKLRGYVQANGLGERVFFVGWQGEISSLLKSVAVVVVPSHGEPFGRVVLEAWAAKVPLVATAAGGPAELIKDGEDGLLVPVGDAAALAEALRRVLGDPVLTSKLTTNGWQRVQEFTVARHAEEVGELYGRLARTGNKCRARRD